MSFTRRRLLKAISAAGLASVSSRVSACGVLAPVAPTLALAKQEPLFTAGLVTDAQYADSDPKGTRFYRNSVQKLGDAVEHFNGRDLAFCMHLGDLIDHTWNSFDQILQPLQESRHRFHHLLGNHDFDVIEQYKPKVPERLQIPTRYTSFDHAGFRFILLDTNDVSVYAWPQGSENKTAAEAELQRLQQENVTQAQSWNGGIGKRQLEWFEERCRNAQVAGLKVVVFAHHPVYPDNVHNLWNSEQVLQVIDRHPQVVAWFNGHNHTGNFADRNGVPFVTMHGMVETAATTAFATAEFHSDRIVVSGHGREPSRELLFRTNNQL